MERNGDGGRERKNPGEGGCRRGCGVRAPSIISVGMSQILITALGPLMTVARRSRSVRWKRNDTSARCHPSRFALAMAHNSRFRLVLRPQTEALTRLLDRHDLPGTLEYAARPTAPRPLLLTRREHAFACVCAALAREARR